ncbi:hypothetical protein QTN25_003719 [Entamoeba marina]
MSHSFVDLKKIMEKLKDSLKTIEKEVNSVEVEETTKLVKKYDVVIKDVVNEFDLILKYETFYDQLNKYVITKRKEINDVEELINSLSEFESGDSFTTILNKKKDNANQIIDCINKIVEKTKELETTIYNNKIKKLNNMKVNRYDIVEQLVKRELVKQEPLKREPLKRESLKQQPLKQQPLKQQPLKQKLPKQVSIGQRVQHKQQTEKTEQLIKTNDKDLKIICNSMNVLKQWSNKNIFNIVFDSKVNGDGSKRVLHDKVYNKSNLYFISFDENNNVFGGFLNNKIDKSGYKYDCCISDENAFVFSLIRNGIVNNKRYFLKNGEDKAFLLLPDSPSGWLYNFGKDVFVFKVGSNESCCTDDDYYFSIYSYKNDKKLFTDITYPDEFAVRRIVVIEMN